jgi:hypothetical protein
MSIARDNASCRRRSQERERSNDLTLSAFRFSERRRGEHVARGYKHATPSGVERVVI